MNTNQNETLAIRLPTALVVHLRHWAFMKEVSLATFIEESLTRFCQELAAENKRQAQETEPTGLLSMSGSFVTTHEKHISYPPPKTAQKERLKVGVFAR